MRPGRRRCWALALLGLGLPARDLPPAAAPPAGSAPPPPASHGHGADAGRPPPRVRVSRTARGLELHVDGTLASLVAAGSGSCGSVWGALAAPLLALPPCRRTRVLILGLGGGSAARAVRALAPGAQIVGVELEQEVVDVARSQLGLDDLGVEVVVGDALDFLQREGRRFDMIIEDVNGGGLHKPGWIPVPGHDLCGRLLADGGVLVSNTFLNGDSASVVGAHLSARYPAVLQMTLSTCGNAVFVASGGTLSAEQLRAAVTGSPVLRDSSRTMVIEDAREHVRAALAAPLLVLPERRRRQVLLLGVGAAGAAAQLEILDGIELIVGDAVEYLEAEQRLFDAIVAEACYQQQPARALELMQGRLGDGGVLAVATVCGGGRAGDDGAGALLRGALPGHLRVSLPGGYVVHAASRSPLDAAAFRAALGQSPSLARSRGAMRIEPLALLGPR
ncbi:unnamed protein product [Prorocentrum cordatum]|uniref:Methyltransferase domain-containing protein n=1 Tax=Prorocentrum cordatum TaxID=2364126 RepID=A0ABN9VJ38_9DINO|nr:unnamed protein product [Polarella glacialis]